MSEPTPVACEPTPTPGTGRVGFRRFSAVEFLGALVLMLFTAPFVENLKNGETIDSALMTLVLVSGVLAVGRNRRTLLLAAVLMLPAVLSRWVHHFRQDALTLEVHHVAALVFIAFVEIRLLHFIFRARRVDSEVLCAGISGYLLLGVLWMLAYMLVSGLNPNPGDAAHPAAFAFNVGTSPAGPLPIFDAYYFSFITLSTVGYGDITPVTHAARTLAMAEAMTGTLYVAVLISRLVAMYSSENLGANSQQPGQRNMNLGKP
ncbi:MAG TPA: potassium channel family protein [Verrucomicrobiae bacterium]|nr:potassium channel family protein [Verrucomicrobiae bacterium]